MPNRRIIEMRLSFETLADDTDLTFLLAHLEDQIYQSGHCDYGMNDTEWEELL